MPATRSTRSRWSTCCSASIATDFVRLRQPTLYALMRAVLFLEEDVESLALIDPGVFLHQLYGEDLPANELLAQRIAAAGALVLQLIDGLSAENEEEVGHVDINYGWDAAPGTATPLADLVSMRTTTFRIGQDNEGAGLLASVNYVLPEHGGPGLFLSFGGAMKLVKEPPPPPQVIDPENPPDTGARYELDAGVGAAFNVFIPFSDEAKPRQVSAGIDNPFLKFTVAAAATELPAFRIGEAKGSRLDVYSTEFGLRIAKDQVALVAALRNAELVIDADDTDSFLRTLVGEGAKVRFSVGLIADQDGLRLDGGTRAAVTVPVGRSLAGLLTVHHLELALGPAPGGGDLALDVGGAFTATLGPVAVAVDRMGFSLQLARLPADAVPGNNLGFINLGLGFKRPEGLGLVVKGDFVKGGGYIFIDKSGTEYAGALELQIGKFGIKAIGMLSTGPGDEWSLLLLLFITLPVQAGGGFTLNGLGGLVGLQHGVDTPQLIAGMKTKAFDDILFPADLVADAPRILNRLRTLFPKTPRALIVAPMVDIGYGTPRFVFIRIGVMIQLENVFGPGSDDVRMSRALLIGQLKVALGPTKDEPDTTVVQLIIDVLGFWDRDQKRYGVIARLRDSKIAIVAITGSLMVFGDYGEHPRFLLAAGGFHPRFKDVPADIGGVLDRLGAAFVVGRFKLAILAYFAISPGTIQFGLDISCTAKIGPVAIKGQLGFDALIYREPRTHFLVDFRVCVEVSYKGHSLAAVKCTGTVEGPGLWHLVGKVTFSILWWDIDKSFDESWGHAPELGTITTDVQGAARRRTAAHRELDRATAGGCRRDGHARAARRRAACCSRTRSAARCSRSAWCRLGLALAALRQHARGRAGEVRPRPRVKLGGVAVPLTACPPVQEHFARAQYLDMSEDDKLAKPSFEPMDAGVEFSSAAFHPSASVLSAALDYETAYLDVDAQGFNPTRPDTRLKGIGIDHAVLGVLAGRGAAAKRAAASRRAAGREDPRPREPRQRTARRCDARHARRRAGREARWCRRPRADAGRAARQPRRRPRVCRWSKRSSSPEPEHGRQHLPLPALGPPRPGRPHHRRRQRRAAAGPRQGERRHHGQRHRRDAVRAAALRPGRRDRRRSAHDRAHRAAPGEHRCRAELLRADRVRPAGLSVAVHAREGRHRRPTAAVVRAGRRRPRPRRRAAHRDRQAAAGASRCSAEAAASELPDLAESWAWAHTQVLTPAGAVNIATELADKPAVNVSRLLAPRRLEPGQRYAACLVPAFDAGVTRGLGDTPVADAPLGPAWQAPFTRDVTPAGATSTGPSPPARPVTSSRWRAGSSRSRRRRRSVSSRCTSVRPARNCRRCHPAIQSATLVMDGALRAPHAARPRSPMCPRRCRPACRPRSTCRPRKAAAGAQRRHRVARPAALRRMARRQHTAAADAAGLAARAEPRSARARRGRPRRRDRAPEPGSLHALVAGSRSAASSRRTG